MVAYFFKWTVRPKLFGQFTLEFTWLQTTTVGLLIVDVGKPNGLLSRGPGHGWTVDLNQQHHLPLFQSARTHKPRCNWYMHTSWFVGVWAHRSRFQLAMAFYYAEVDLCVYTGMRMCVVCLICCLFSSMKNQPFPPQFPSNDYFPLTFQLNTMEFLGVLPSTSTYWLYYRQ